MRIILVWVGFMVVLVHADESKWKTFQLKYNKTYKDESERQLRQNIFNENLKKIEENNKEYEQGLVSFKLGINKFSDMTKKEFQESFGIMIADDKILQSEPIKNYFRSSAGNLPESIDWRKKSAVTEVKNQDSCGACWAFSATGTIEGQMAIHDGVLKSLSEQQLLDCDPNQLGCTGGVVQNAIVYAANNGLTLESDYPYSGVKGTCRSKKANGLSKKRVLGYVNILENDENDLKQAVALVGPVSVAINADPIMQYETGIFDAPCSNNISHAVLAVGYGKDNITKKNYWILKNSWGKVWGEAGYIRMVMGKNLCGITRQACYAVINSGSSNDDKNFKSMGSSIFKTNYLTLFVLLLAAHLYTR